MKSMEQILNHNLLRDMIAAELHDIWVETTKTLASEEQITPKRVKRWEEYWKPYTALSNDVKNQDRVLADRIIKTLTNYLVIIETHKVRGLT